MNEDEQEAELPEWQQRRRELRHGVSYVALGMANYKLGMAGCGLCQFGLLGNLRADGPGPLYILRAYQAHAKQIEFCSCVAGQAYRRSLLKTWRAVKDGTDYVPPGMAQAIDAWLQLEA